MSRRGRDGLLFGLVAVLLGAGSGCALNSPTFDLAYTPEPGKKSPLSTLAPMSVAVQVEDQRDVGERDRLADKKNNLGTVTARVFCKREPAQVLQEALAREFANNGHRVVDDTSGADAVVQVRLKKYWSDAIIHFWDVEMIATLNTDVSILDRKKGSKPPTCPLNSVFRDSAQIATDDCHEKVLNGVLAESVRCFARDPAILKALQEIQGK